MFRVDAVDNFNRETVSDISVCTLRTKERAQLVADMINEDAGPEPSRWCCVRDAATPAYRFEP